MIAYLEGTVLAQELEGVVLLIGGIGYRVQVARSTAEVGDRLMLWIEEVIREDRHDLYGFVTTEDRRVFQLLTGVQGVGPKLAMKILSSSSAETLIGKIHAGDVDFFTSLSGIGKKTAQKIILDLKGALIEPSGKAMTDEVAEALQGLGYRIEDIRGVVASLPEGTTEERLKAALQQLARYAR